MERYEYCNGELSSPIWHSQSAFSLPPSPPPPQFCLRIVFNFLRDDCNNKEKIQTTVMLNNAEQTKSTKWCYTRRFYDPLSVQLCCSHVVTIQYNAATLCYAEIVVAKLTSPWWTIRKRWTRWKALSILIIFMALCVHDILEPLLRNLVGGGGGRRRKETELLPSFLVVEGVSSQRI